MHNDKNLADVNLPEPIRRQEVGVQIDPIHLLLGLVVFGIPLGYVVIQIGFLLLIPLLLLSKIIF